MRQRRENHADDALGLPPVANPYCVKRAYQSKQRAKLAIRRMRGDLNGVNSRGDWKAYRCRLCGNYHLTSGKKP